MGQENDDKKEICQTFVPQKWRKTKCQSCFQDIAEHRSDLKLAEESKVYTKQCSNLNKVKEGYQNKHSVTTQSNVLLHNEGRSILTENKINGRRILTSTSTLVGDNEQHSYSSQSNYTQEGSSKEGSSDQIDADIEREMKDSDNDDETADEGTPYRRRKKMYSPFSLEHMDSHDAEDGTITPNRMSQKRRSKNKGKNNSNLLSLSAMMLSSNSSLCSYNSELTDGYSDYDYDIRSVTDDTDDYAELPNGMIEELELIKPELKARVENERRVSRSRIISLERELEGQQDYYRANEVAKDRQLKSLQRDIEGLKFELSSLKAHENILALKSRLELEGKSNRIHELEQQIEVLKEEIDEVSKAPDAYESQHELLSRELARARNWIAQLEDENRQAEERMKLAEDLQHNDKEWIDMLQKQCSSLEKDLNIEQTRNSQLEDKLKLLDMMRNDFLKEQEKHVKTNKELELMRQKVKRRDRHIEDLEDDNVKLQKMKEELESNLAKKDFKIKKLEKKVAELQNEVANCNKEIADLTGENKTLEQVRRLTDLKLKDMSSIAQTTEVVTNEQFFINTLEDRLKHRESRLKELELENDNYLKEIKELYDNLLDVEKQREDCREQIKDNEMRMTKMRQEGKHNEKKIELLHRKLQKCEKEKRRALNRQNNAERKLSQYQQDQETAIAATSRVDNCDEPASYDWADESGFRMLKLKLQSTEAQLSVFEHDNGCLESKVMTLERKLINKEQEILRLNDSMERDSGAPSQDCDRFDALERENILLQTKLDELSFENDEQKSMVYKLKEGNQHLETTIQELNNKLDSCTKRLKGLEEANHSLGREALKRNEIYNHTQDEVAHSLSELKEHNKALQEKLKHFDNLEDAVVHLEQQVKTEKSYVQWYFDENEKLKIQTAKMADTIRTLERSKFEFEQSVRELSDTNKDLNNDVKRLEQKLEIYTELFDKDSNFHTSLKRRSFQDHQEQADEKLIENALAPLMEEIKEKDLQIRNLQKAVEEKEIIVNSLNKEIDTLETNLASMVLEKIRNMHVPKEKDGREDAEDGFTNNKKLFSTDSLQELKQPPRKALDKNDDVPHSPTHSTTRAVATLSYIDEKIRIGEPCTLLLSTSQKQNERPVSLYSSPPLSPVKRQVLDENSFSSSPPKETYLALTSKTVSDSLIPATQESSVEIDSNKPNSLTISIDKEMNQCHSYSQYSPDKSSPCFEDDLSITRSDFYRMLQKHEDEIKKRDEQYLSSSSQTEEATTPSGSIYRTIESALLDQYRDDDEHHSNLTSNIPSLDDYRRLGGSPPYASFMEAAANAAGVSLNHVTNVDNKSMSNIKENQKLVEDMYDQLAQLEDLVAEKYSNKKYSSESSNTTVEEGPQEQLALTESRSSEVENSKEEVAPPPRERGTLTRVPSISQRQSSRESNLGLPSNTSFLCRTPSTSSTLSQDSNNIDLSGLDDLLAEVDQRGGHEKYSIVVQDTKRRTVSGLEHKPVLSKTMPTLRTTKKRIMNCGGLNRTGSLDSTRTKPKIHSTSAIISHSSSNLHQSTFHRNVNVEISASRFKKLNTSTSSLEKSSSTSSVVYVPDKDGNVSIPPPLSPKDFSSPSQSVTNSSSTTSQTLTTYSQITSQSAIVFSSTTSQSVASSSITTSQSVSSPSTTSTSVTSLPSTTSQNAVNCSLPTSQSVASSSTLKSIGSSSSITSQVTTPPYRRPKLESCRFFSSSSNSIGGSEK